MKKTITILMISILFLLTPSFIGTPVKSNVSAASEIDKLYDQLKELEDRQSALTNELNKTKNDKQTELEKLSALNDDIAIIESQLTVLNDIIASINEQLEQKNNELVEANKELDDFNVKYRQRVRATYEEGQASYLEVVLNSKDFSDFLIRVDVVSQIIEHDTRLINDMKEKRRLIEAAKHEIQVKKIENETAKNKLSMQQKSMQSKIDLSEQAIDKLTAEEKQTLKEINDAEKALDELNDRIDDLISKNSEYVGGEFGWPVPNYYYITSYFGNRRDPLNPSVFQFHKGIDIGAPIGASIVASNAGTVVANAWDPNGGNYTVIDHGGGFSTRYFHCNKILVSVGQTVSRGEKIAEVGRTGARVTGPHLHFEIRNSGTSVNPLNYLKK